MPRARVDHKKLGIHDLRLCRECLLGRCCKDGVEVDLFEVARILKRKLAVSAPWFRYLGRNKEFPSGFHFTTVIRNGRCVFQAQDRRCLVYDIRPRYCREFPLEDGRRAPHYHVLCHHPRKKKGKRPPLPRRSQASGFPPQRSAGPPKN